MVDYAIDGGFDIYTNNRGTIDTVEDVKEFEQDLVTRLHFRLRDASGYAVQSNTLKEKINTIARRAATEYDVLDSIHRISINEKVGENKIELEIEYTTNESFQELI